MTQEEKAKAYDEAIKKAKEFKNNPFAGYDGTDLISALFPELREESEDERIKHEIKVVLTNTDLSQLKVEYTFANMLAWLEKQGEQKLNKVEPKFKVGDYIERKDGLGCHAKIIFIGKNVYGCEKLIYSEDSSPFFELMFNNQDEFQISSDFKQNPADKIEPKFKVGDWILYSGDHYEGVRHITKIDENGYYIERNGLPHGIIPFNHEICMRLWTIQNAKDGDVLACENGWTCIFKCLNDNLFSSYCFMDHEGWFCEDGGQGHTLDNRICGEIYPATNEQRDTLMKAMADAGYTFDFDKRELKKIEQKSAKWSEEDEKTIHNIDAAIRHEVVFPIDELKSMEIWLESLKYRICPKHEWKRDEKMFQLIEDVINVYRKTQGSVIGGIHTEELKDYLKSLRPQNNITDEELAQAKKDAYNDALDKIEYHSGEPTFDDGWSAAIWYLKKKNAMPQTQWKPSDEQMEIIDMLLTNEAMDDNVARVLRELKEQLKKLKGEDI